jgi:hypothetical protein
MAEWVVWYSDRSSFSSEDGEPWDAPRTGVQCIQVAHSSCGSYTLAEQDFYCWHLDPEKDTWVPHDTQGMYQYLQDKNIKHHTVLFGYWIPRETYADIRHKAGKDKRLPPITARPPRQPEG